MNEKREELLHQIKQFLEAEEEIFGPLAISDDGLFDVAESETTTDEAQIKQAEKKLHENAPTEKATQKQTTASSQRLEACNSLEKLKKLCETADELRTDLKGTNLVFGTGNPNADLMLIGEAPGEQEDRQGEPFVGAAGQLLNKILAAINFSRDDVYIANILKHRPPGNRNPNEEECRNSLPYLYKQIELVNPKIILCLGKVSGTTLLGKDTTLKSMRGTFYPFRGAELAVTYHPAALLRNPQWKRPTWKDVQRVRKRYDELGGKP
jgi:DNA polymerase